jgi:nitrile hydratase beta subunit
VNWPHDLGGAQSFGPVTPEAEEPVFHAEWERRALALSLSMNASGVWNIDMVRHARERIPPAEYLAASYYEKWLKGLERLLVEHGLVTPEELATGKSLSPSRSLPRKPTAATVPAMLGKGTSFDRAPASAAMFKVGDKVRAKVMHPPGHTRLPRYVRGRVGRIAALRGAHVYPDANSKGEGEDPRWLYSVTFAAGEVWGPQGHEGDEIVLDLWEPYLERL